MTESKIEYHDSFVEMRMRGDMYAEIKAHCDAEVFGTILGKRIRMFKAYNWGLQVVWLDGKDILAKISLPEVQDQDGLLFDDTPVKEFYTEDRKLIYPEAFGRLAINPSTYGKKIFKTEDDLPDGWRWF